jgi:hypothetical protein
VVGGVELPPLPLLLHAANATPATTAATAATNLRLSLFIVSPCVLTNY